MSDKQMAITLPPGSVATGTDLGFHRRYEGHTFRHGGRHPTPCGNSTAHCLDCRYDAIFSIGLMLLTADPGTAIFTVKQESGFSAEDDILPA